MGGNRKHGFMRGNASGRRRAFWEIDWRCDGCLKMKPYHSCRNGTLDGQSLCNRCDYKRMAIAAAQRQGATARPVSGQ